MMTPSFLPLQRFQAMLQARTTKVNSQSGGDGAENTGRSRQLQFAGQKNRRGENETQPSRDVFPYSEYDGCKHVTNHLRPEKEPPKRTGRNNSYLSHRPGTVSVSISPLTGQCTYRRVLPHVVGNNQTLAEHCNHPTKRIFKSRPKRIKLFLSNLTKSQKQKLKNMYRNPKHTGPTRLNSYFTMFSDRKFN